MLSDLAGRPQDRAYRFDDQWKTELSRGHEGLFSAQADDAGWRGESHGGCLVLKQRLVEGAEHDLVARQPEARVRLDQAATFGDRQK
jgi:hypothetical protein